MLVTTKVVFCREKHELSRQNFCRDKILFVVTKICLSRQKTYFVATNTTKDMCLLRQNFSCLVFAPTSHKEIGGECRDKTQKDVFCRDKPVLVPTNPCVFTANDTRGSSRQ